MAYYVLVRADEKDHFEIFLTTISLTIFFWFHDSFGSKTLPPALILANSTSFRDDESSLSDKSIEFYQAMNEHVTAETRAFAFADAEDDNLSPDTCISGSDVAAEADADDVPAEEEIIPKNSESFTSLRITYLIVTLVVMLADGLQGTFVV